MSEHNYAGLLFKHNLETQPEVFTINSEELDAKLKQGREARQKLDAVNHVPEGPAKELARLRRELFCLTERAKSTETYCCNKAGEVKLLERRLTEAIKQKKVAVADGNERAERNCEHAIKQLEVELVDVEKECQRARRVSAGAAADLKQWSHYARV